MRNGTLAIVIGGLVCTVIAGVQLGPLAASGMALGAALILAFRSNAATAGLRALRYARLEKQIKYGLERYGLPTPDPSQAGGDPISNQVRAAYRDRGIDQDHDPDALDGFRVGGISFDQDARATAAEHGGKGLRGPDGRMPRPRVEKLPLAVRLRDQAGEPLPQMVAQNRERLANEALAQPRGPDEPPARLDRPFPVHPRYQDPARHLPDDADPRCKGNR